MLPRESVVSEKGSMLPLFAGLTALALVLTLGAAEICSMYLYRESIQETADQVALIAAQQNLQTEGELASKISGIVGKLNLAHFQKIDGQTSEVRLCGQWNSWFRLPGLSTNQLVCANSAAR